MSEMQSKTVVKDKNAKLPVSKAGGRGRSCSESELEANNQYPRPEKPKGKVARAQKTTAGTPAPLPYCSTATATARDLTCTAGAVVCRPSALDRAAILIQQPTHIPEKTSPRNAQ